MHYGGLVANYPYYGNDRYGDCVTAAIGHQEQLYAALTKALASGWVPGTFYGPKYSITSPTNTQVVAEYLKLTGGADSGLVISDTMWVWQRTGLWGDKISAFTHVNWKNHTLVKQAVAFYGSAHMGLQLPANAETQFDANQPWTLVPGWQSIKNWGGHAVPVVSYDANWLYVVTWGRIQRMSWDYMDAYADEMWVVIDDKVSALGGLDNINISQLQADLVTV